MKNSYLQTLNSPQKEARHGAAMVIAKVAGIEMPHGVWPELIPLLLEGVRASECIYQ
jgi:importin subunit beta-1